MKTSIQFTAIVSLVSLAVLCALLGLDTSAAAQANAKSVATVVAGKI